MPNTTERRAIPEKSIRDYDEQQKSWAKVVNEILKKHAFGAHDNISRSAHFATSQDPCQRPPAISGLMPLFRDNAHSLYSLAMVKHAWM